MAKDDRARVWATILYTESCASDYQQIISSWHVPALVSPLHDRDREESGELKKPHYHLMIWFEGKKSRDQVKMLFTKVCGVGCEKVDSKIGMARYLCHLDNEDKAKYSVSDVVQFSGADYILLITSEIDREHIIIEMEQFCDDNNILCYATLSRWARDNRPDWHRVLNSSCTIHMTAYLKSLQYEQKMIAQQQERRMIERD